MSFRVVCLVKHPYKNSHKYRYKKKHKKNPKFLHQDQRQIGYPLNKIFYSKLNSTDYLSINNAATTFFKLHSAVKHHLNTILEVKRSTIIKRKKTVWILSSGTISIKIIEFRLASEKLWKNAKHPVIYLKKN